MKKFLFALAMLPLLAFVSCSSDDDDNTVKIDFDHNIELLYGQWQATGVEIGDQVIDLTLTNEEGEAMFAPTFVTFAKDGVFSSKGLIGEGTGVFTTKGKTIVAVTGEDKEDKLSFEMTSLEAETAKIELNAQDLDLGMDIPDEVGNVTVILTKQVAK